MGKNFPLLAILLASILLPGAKAPGQEPPEEKLIKKAESLRLGILLQRKSTWVKTDQPSRPAENPEPIPASNIQVTQARMRQNIGLIQKSAIGAIPSRKRVLARVTTYWAEGSGTDPWSARNQSSTQTPLVCRHHAAVDPNIFPYGSKLLIQYKGGRIAVQAVDTGGDVKNRRASRKLGETPQEQAAPVVDLFFQRKEDALAYAKNHPPFQWVEVIPPTH